MACPIYMKTKTKNTAITSFAENSPFVGDCGGVDDFVGRFLGRCDPCVRLDSI